VATLLAAIGRGHGPVARLSRSLSERRRASHDDAGKSAAHDSGGVVVTASGNLGFVYFREMAGRAMLEDIELCYPNLVTRLGAHAAVGFIVARSRENGVVVLGRDGVNYLEHRRVVGTDPLAPFGRDAPGEVLRHAALANVGDLVVNSNLDNGDVAAFEELVGCHGGLGGWQSDALLIHPVDWVVEQPLVGADAVHRQLVSWLESLGLRRTRAGHS